MTAPDNNAPGAGRPYPAGPPPYPYGGPPPGYGWTPPPVPVSPDGRPLADFGTRLLAYMIDGALLGAGALVVTAPFLVWFITHWTAQLSTYPNTTLEPDPMDIWRDFFLPMLFLEGALFVVMLIVTYVYHVELMFRSGQTLGKKWLKLQVVPIEPGGTLTRTRAAKRYAVEFVAATFVPLLSYLDGLWQLWDKPFQQTLHDKAAGTVVIKVAP
ncbi:RDD family protein [Actinoplanes sp. N902-109]|uniref:RDD family protein n=1 Tax=Actinoplanes sp. (strain N902-109) TaxID=649831 RepID=UPI000329587B|nr:RDD family protein [Actinoplanes sp. N902-109]AGL21332.1 RDD domain-containing protein [Actinoplanes sp. N902-109]